MNSSNVKRTIPENRVEQQNIRRGQRTQAASTSTSDVENPSKSEPVKPQSTRDIMRAEQQARQEAVKQRQQSQGTRSDVKAAAQQSKKNKKQSFLKTRMWINYLLSSMQKDRGKIPDNIGNKMLITNNMYVTRYYMSSVIHVTSLSLDTPQTWTSELTHFLRKRDCDAVIDFKFKNKPMDVDIHEQGMQARIAAWERTADSPDATYKEKETAARCLYTCEELKSGKDLMETRIFITVRAKLGSKLAQAEKLVFTYLNSIGANYELVSGSLKDKLQYMFLMSNQHFAEVKDMKAVVNSNQTLAQMLPNTNAFNSHRGTYMGINVLNNTQYLLDWRAISIARNLYIIAPSGVGKTVMALNLCCSAREDGYAVCIQDIKGNEFNNFVNGTGGYIVSLREYSTGYINSWKMNADDTTDEQAESYFTQRVNLSKEQMTILAGLTEQAEKTDLAELLDAFHNSLYISLGVMPSNRNTWSNTQDLNPFVIYEKFIQYMTPEMQRKYSLIARRVINNLRMYMSKSGTKSYIFKQEFDYLSILKAPTLMFDFGILEGSDGMSDPAVFRLKFAYMRKLNAEFVAYKYSKGIKVLKILEEAQIAVRDPEIMAGYVEEYTLRRAQGQTTVLLGNSISALVDNYASAPLIENTRALMVGELPPKALQTVIDCFGLEDYRELLEVVGTTPEYKNSFVFVNNMESKAIMPILKVHLDKKKYKLLTPVAQKIGAMN